MVLVAHATTTAGLKRRVVEDTLFVDRFIPQILVDFIPSLGDGPPTMPFFPSGPFCTRNLSFISEAKVPIEAAENEADVAEMLFFFFFCSGFHNDSRG